MKVLVGLNVRVGVLVGVRVGVNVIVGVLLGVGVGVLVGVKVSVGVDQRGLSWGEGLGWDRRSCWCIARCTGWRKCQRGRVRWEFQFGVFVGVNVNVGVNDGV